MALALLERKFSQPMKYYLNAKALVKPSEESSGTKVCDADFHANYDLLKMFIVRAITPEGIPSLTDFKVALVHLSCTHALHPGVRARGGKQVVKDWSAEQGGKFRAILAQLARVTRRTLDAKSKRTKVLKNLFAAKMGWTDDNGELLDVVEEIWPGFQDAPAAAAAAAVIMMMERQMMKPRVIMLEPQKMKPHVMMQDLERELHRLMSQRDLEMDEAMEDDGSFKGPEDVPRPDEILDEEAMFELECWDEERSMIPTPRELPSTPAVADSPEEKLDHGSSSANGSAAGFKDRAPLLPDRCDIPPELLDMLDDDKTCDLNGTRDKQRCIKAVQKQAMEGPGPRAKAAMNAKMTEQTPSPKLGKSAEPVSDPMQKARRGRKPKRAAEPKEKEQAKAMPSASVEAEPKEKDQTKAMPSSGVEAEPKENDDQTKAMPSAVEAEPKSKKRKPNPGPKPKAKAESKAKAKAEAKGKAKASKAALTEEQKEQESVKRQQTADENTQLIRTHADELPDLSFTVWPPRGKEDMPEINPITVWELAKFIAGWLGDVDPLDEGDRDLPAKKVRKTTSLGWLGARTKTLSVDDTCPWLETYGGHVIV
ncbi:unnamed protein product [Symbiodinium sp. KB8]|nr:unnamed protein product [Symbiodinium sp. KB8]